MWFIVRKSMPPDAVAVVKDAPNLLGSIKQHLLPHANARKHLRHEHCASMLHKEPLEVVELVQNAQTLCLDFACLVVEPVLALAAASDAVVQRKAEVVLALHIVEDSMSNKSWNHLADERVRQDRRLEVPLDAGGEDIGPKFVWDVPHRVKLATVCKVNPLHLAARVESHVLVDDVVRPRPYQTHTQDERAHVGPLGVHVVKEGLC
mmetsp:Transcript_23231/g.58221  ORF Transcript_23231/g.58221 Transcript_23231/m.58221 type:complete len:206 (+) Transcript_23231:707-1324(+)